MNKEPAVEIINKMIFFNESQNIFFINDIYRFKYSKYLETINIYLRTNEDLFKN